MLTQSEILGFDTKQFSSTPSKNLGIADSISNVTAKIFSLFDKGAEIAGNVTDRITALRIIDAEIAEAADAPVQISIPKSERQGFSKSALNTGLLVGGALLATIVLFRILK